MKNRLRAWLRRQWEGDGEFVPVEPVGEFKPFDPATPIDEAAAILNDPDRLSAEWDAYMTQMRRPPPTFC